MSGYAPELPKMIRGYGENAVSFFRSQKFYISNSKAK